MKKALFRERQQPICPECGSTKIRFRISFRDYLCERCGWKGQEPEFKGKEMVKKTKPKKR